MNKSKLLLSLLLVSFFWGCQKDQPTTVENSDFLYDQVKPSNEYATTYAIEWMDMAYSSVRQRGFFALDASRLYAYTSLTMYESMVHGIPNGLSMEDQLTAFRLVPKPKINARYDWGIVLCHATPQVLIHMLNNPSTEIVRNISELERRQEARLINESNIPHDVIANSKEFASLLANFIINYANNDNTSQMMAREYVMPPVSQNPANYDGIGDNNPFFMAPYWWGSRSFVISSERICTPLPPYTYSEDPASKYYKDVLEVLDATRDPQKVRIGEFWANNPGQSGTPAGSWVGIANQLANQLNTDMETTLRMYLLLTLSTRDTFIAVWWTKYHWNLQRPVSYIRRVLGYPNWTSPVPTPPYPDYVSGTSANAGSSSEILTSLFGNNQPFTDAQHFDKGFGIREFPNFKRAGFEAYHSRIYAGVHMRKACEEGFKMGECVARDLLRKIRFTKQGI